MRKLILAAALAFAVSGCLTTKGDTVRSILVGSRVCPSLNAHEQSACRFSVRGHGFQVWPDRIQIKKTSESGWYQVTQGGAGVDMMFDHTLRRRKDDHVAFECFIRPADGAYLGPFGFRIKRGGVWATYGYIISTSAAVATGVVTAAVVAPAGGAPGVAAGVAGSFAGGAAARYLGKALSKLGDRSWEKEAAWVADNICKILAANLRYKLKE